MSNPNNYLKQQERALTRKLELIEEKGGKCEICGYDKNIAALDFHHLNPEAKLFQLDSRHLSNTTIVKLREEADKCILVCANCHREIHNKHLDKSNIPTLLNEMVSKHISLEHKNKTSICKHCGKEFPYSKNKIYCSDECREADKGYPTYDEINANMMNLSLGIKWLSSMALHAEYCRELDELMKINLNYLLFSNILCIFALSKWSCSSVG